MRPDLLWLPPIAVGHLALFVLLTNTLHGLGDTETTLARVKLGLLAAFSVVAAGLAWAAWHGPFPNWPRPVLAYAAVCLLMGLVVLPVNTALRSFRRDPRGVESLTTELDLASALGADALTGTGRHSWMLSLPGNESLRLRKVEWVLTLPGLPAALDGLSILHLSDLHLTPNIHRRYFEAVADEAAAWESDLVVFTGDLVDHDEALDWVVPVLSRVRGRLGSYAILGNHDLGHDPALVRRLLVAAGFTDLEACWETVAVAGAVLALGGTSFPWGPALPLDDPPRADYRVLLSHSPDLFYRAERAGFDLMLSGHNHGGQVRLPVVGAVFMPSVFSRRFDRGFFRRNGLTLHVSQGVSGKHPLRYGCVPEIGRLVLRAAPADRRDPGHATASRSHGLAERSPAGTVETSDVRTDA